ncbi:HEAT repeat domain-containing protein [Polymorphospora sp. NPDC051019]|uniref:NACHT domain-containing protein n=1 Tax=Polymorphospora sp. NPDC051019 TaxID=3155725 RepID=UPI00341FDB43
MFVAPSVVIHPSAEDAWYLRQKVTWGSGAMIGCGAAVARELRWEAEKLAGPQPVRALPVLAAPAARRLVLLGDAGAGKSTLVRYLALVLAGELSDGELDGLAGWLPVLVDVGDWAADPDRTAGTVVSLAAHLHATAEPEPSGVDLDAFLAGDGRAVILVDGLDVIDDPASRDAAAARIAAFADRYPRTRIVVTSRTAGYRRRILDAAGFTHHLLQDLGREQIEMGARRLCAAHRPHDPGAAGRLLAAIDDAPALAELAGSPLLLMILSTGRPEVLDDRRAAYEYVRDVFARPGPGHRGRPTDPDGCPAPVRRHLVADGIVERHTAGELSDDDVVDLFRTRWTDPDWRGVLPHVVAGIPRLAGRAIDPLLRAAPFGYWWTDDPPHHALLAIRCLTEIDIATARTLRTRQIVNTVLDLLEGAYEWEKYSCDERWTRVLVREVRPVLVRLGPAWAGHAGYADWYRLRVSDLSPGLVIEDSVQSLATDIAAGLDPAGAGGNPPTRVVRGPDHPVPAAGERATPVLLDHPSPQERAAALKALAASRHVDADTAARIRDCLSDEWAEVRGAALEAVTALRDLTPEVGAVLRDRVRNEASLPIRRDMVRLLVAGWPDQPETATVLRTLVTTDAGWSVRIEALRALATHWRHDPQTVRYVRGCVVFDPDRRVREIAVRVLFDGWRDEPGTVRFLHGRALEAEDGAVRQIALEALREGWRDDPRTLRFLRRRTVADPEPAIRRLALLRLIDDWRDEPDTAAFVRGRIADPDRFFRLMVVQALAICWPDLPGTLELLHERAVHDWSGDVRAAALRALATGWPDDPDTRRVLRERALLGYVGPDREVARWSLLVGWPDELPELRAASPAV